MVQIPLDYVILFFCGLITPFIISLICYIFLFLKYLFKKIPKDFTSQHVMIIGASYGIGESLSYILGKQNIKLSIAARSLDKLEELKSKILNTNKNIKISCYKLDVTVIDDCKNFIKKSINLYGIPSLLINCAGIAHPGFILDNNYEQYHKDMQLNYFGNLNIIKELFHYLDYIKFKFDKNIDIVGIGSVLGIMGSIGYTCYVPTKYALKGLFDSLQFEYCGKNINFHYYAPSNMKTPGLLLENKTKPKIVSFIESNAKTITSHEAGLILLSNLNKYIITSECDLELLKSSSYFMNKFNIIDFFLLPLSSIGVIINYFSILKSIKKYISKEKIN